MITDDERAKAVQTKDAAYELGNKIIDFLNNEGAGVQLSVLALALVLANMAHAGSDPQKTITYFVGATQAALKDLAIEYPAETVSFENTTLQ